MNIKIFFAALIVLFVTFFSYNFVAAQNSTTEQLYDSIAKQNNAFQNSSEIGPPQDIRIIVARIIKVFLGFVGFLATVYLVYGGYMYMTSAGNESRASDASKIMLYSALGILIILTSYSITNYVYKIFERSLLEQNINNKSYNTSNLEKSILNEVNK